MLVDEKEVEEFVVRARNGHEPGRRQCEVEHESRGEVEPTPHREIPGERRIDDERATGEHDADQSLRQRGAGERRRGDPHPQATRPRVGFRTLGNHECAEADGRKNDSPESSVTICAMTTCQTVVASASPAYAPSVTPPSA